MVHCLRKRVVLGTSLVMLAFTPVFSASGALYLDLPTVPGPSTAVGHVDWIKAESLQWGVGVPISSSKGGVRGVGSFSASEPVWSQRVDTSVPGLFNASLAGIAQPQARFDLVSGSRTDGAPYLSLEMGTQTFLTGVSLGNDYVSASIGSDRYKLTYDPKGLNRKGASVSTELDFAKRTAKGSGGRSATAYTGSISAASGGGTSMYLRLGDSTLNIAGDSQARGYENWIDLGSVQMGVGRSFSVGSSGGSSGTLSAPSVSDLTWTQQDVATVPAILTNLAQGKQLSKAVIEYVMQGSNAPVTFMQLVLEDVLFSGLSLSASETSVNAAVSINFLKMTQTVWDVEGGVRAVGTKGTTGYTSFSYDVAKNTSGKGAPDTSTIALFGSGNLDGIVNAAASQSALPPMAPAIPEPKTWVMMLAGLSVLLSAVFRKKA